AAEGSHTITVQSLARAHSVGSAAFAGDAIATVSGTHGFQITAAGKTATITVSIVEGATWREVLQSVAAAIAASDAGVSAAVVTPNALTGETRLLLTSRETGTQACIEQIADSEGTLAATMGLAGSSSAEAYAPNTLQTAADAEFTLDGLDFLATGNHVTGVLTGVTLDLRATTGLPVTLSIARDTESVRGGLEDFLSTYNTVIDFLREKTSAADATGANRGEFTGDTLFVGLRGELRAGLTDPVSGLAAEDLARLSELGITADRQGRLAISDPAALEGALSAHPEEVERLFRAEGTGIAQRMVERIDRYVETDGPIGQRTEALDARGRLLDRQMREMEARLESREKQLTQYFASLQASLTALIEQQASLSELLSGS
ncbi:MAG: flagellar filament capping protein FliD, partial [Candidatus Eisenbacteria bacterium]